MINILFFQATATVIPTMLTATALTARIGDWIRWEVNDETADEDKHAQTEQFLYGITGLTIYLVAAIMGEAGALAALVSGIPRNFYFVLVITALMLMFMTFALATVMEKLPTLADLSSRRFTIVLSSIIFGMTTFVIIVLSAAVHLHLW